MIDLGHEPPLSVDGSEAAVIDRRRVSVQWFSGTILTGLCGAALIGGAVFASLDGEMTFAKVPERVEGALRGAFGANDKTASLHKSDRLPPPGESTAARNVVRVSTVTRVGNRDVMRVRPFIRISGNLSMTTSDLSAKIPPFNAQRMLTDVGAAAPAASDDPNNADAVEPDAEVSFVTKDLAPILPQGEARRGGRARRGSDAGARCLELARQQRRALRPRQRRRPTPAARSPTSNWPTPPRAPSPIPMPALKPGWCRKTSRCCRRPKIRPPAAIPQRANASTWSRRAIPSPRSCAIRAPRRKRPNPSPPRSAPAAATAA